MPQIHPLSSDAGNTFEDLSGISYVAFSNPYDALIDACQDDPKQIQSRYSTHRVARNAKQKDNLLGADFRGLNLDSILQRLEDPSIEPGFVDPRHSLVFWARPPPHIRELASQIQKKLKEIAPSLWLMPPQNFHMTALEITHSVTEPEISALISQLQPSIPAMTDLSYNHRSRLIKPLLCYDSSALALSFLPAAGEGLSVRPGSTAHADASSEQQARTASDDVYTYHHLRHDLYAMAHSAGLAIESRYVVPSAHITIARFLTQVDHDGPEKMERWMRDIEGINDWLEEEYWPRTTEPRKKTEKGGADSDAAKQGEEGGQAIWEQIRDGGEWIVGEGKGLDLRKGVLWYGGGETVRLGQGF